MPRTTLPVTDAVAASPLTAVNPTETSADVANGNQFPHTGREVLEAFNSDTVAHNVTLHSVPVRGRQDPLHATAQSIPAGGRRVYGPFGDGWRQTDGYVYVNADHATVRFRVLRLPAQ